MGGCFLLRKAGMTEYRVRHGADSYGHAVGVILIEVSTPFIPGDVGNASTFPFPVLYKTVSGVTLSSLIDRGDTGSVDDVIAVARELERHGVRVITSDCGYMIHYQARVAAAVSVPVVLSSLLMLPMLEAGLPATGKIGVICANKARLTEKMLRLAGMRNPERTAIAGMEDSEAFRKPVLEEFPILDSEAIEKDICARAKTLIETNPEIGPILLECSNMPAYGHAVQRVTGRPVFDFTTMLAAYHSASFRAPFAGYY